MVLDMHKNKMSKSVGNVVSPAEVISKYNRDYMRYYFAKLSRGEDFAYDEREFKEIANFFRVLLNVNNFISQIEEIKDSECIEDKWIVSKYNNLIKEVTKSFDDYRFYEAVIKIEKFLVQDLSRNYMQMIRDRASETHSLMSEIIQGLVKMLAPVSPFISEKIWGQFKEEGIIEEESVFLSEWPSANDKKINIDLEEDFFVVLKIIEKGLAERDKNKIGLRWPLSKARITCSLQLSDELKELICRQLNLKNLEVIEGKEIFIELDTQISEELEAEGFAREISRKVQAERKNRGMEKKDKIVLKLSVDSELRRSLEGFVELIKERTGADKISFNDGRIQKNVEFEVKGKKIIFGF